RAAQKSRPDAKRQNGKFRSQSAGSQCQMSNVPCQTSKLLVKHQMTQRPTTNQLGTELSTVATRVGGGLGWLREGPIPILERNGLSLQQLSSISKFHSFRNVWDSSGLGNLVVGLLGRLTSKFDV